MAPWPRVSAQLVLSSSMHRCTAADIDKLTAARGGAASAPACRDEIPPPARPAPPDPRALSHTAQLPHRSADCALCYAALCRAAAGRGSARRVGNPGASALPCVAGSLPRTSRALSLCHSTPLAAAAAADAERPGESWRPAPAATQPRRTQPVPARPVPWREGRAVTAPWPRRRSRRAPRGAGPRREYCPTCPGRARPAAAGRGPAESGRHHGDRGGNCQYVRCALPPAPHRRGRIAGGPRSPHRRGTARCLRRRLA